ncbi:MAG: hypothetical protein OQJ80_02525 [Kangiella sp.]|jgi:hypothetical protein|nr:hypothetical protein [Kangiella sp.]
MDFTQVEKPFEEWAKENNLPISRSYQDSEVRSVNLFTNNQTKKWQLWLEPNPKDDSCTIKYWDYAKQRHEMTVSVPKLKSALNKITESILQ